MSSNNMNSSDNHDEDSTTQNQLAEQSLEPNNFSIKHPLQNRWTLWFDNPGKKTTQESWAENLKKIVTFDTVEDFWRVFNNIQPVSSLAAGSNYHLFKENIEPKWEHTANQHGGKWVVIVKTQLFDKQWLWSVLACIGESFEDDEEICGCVASVRKSQSRISLWTRNASNESAQRRIGSKFKQALEIPDNVSVGYQVHSDSIKRNSSYNNKNRYEV
mmetsp:Transcript_26247/g.36964  ORF Transcript_26247/g.36964 Transcript_26247/m.36964 type:complete len:216 (+) Transcript_26247:167-814(+)